jgi:hypothetical protein
MNWSDLSWLNGWYFAHTGFLYSECHHSHYHFSLTAIFSISVTMAAGKQLMIPHLLTADLMLIQILHKSHDNDIWNYPCNIKDQMFLLDSPVLPSSCMYEWRQFFQFSRA